jgi:hypothetical protein
MLRLSRDRDTAVRFCLWRGPGALSGWRTRPALKSTRARWPGAFARPRIASRHQDGSPGGAYTSLRGCRRGLAPACASATRPGLSAVTIACTDPYEGIGPRSLGGDLAGLPMGRSDRLRGEPSARPSISITNSLAIGAGGGRCGRGGRARPTRPRGSRQASAARSEAAHRRDAPPRQAARHPQRAGGSPASVARHRRGRARQARNVVGRPRIYQAANGVWLTGRVQPSYLSGSGPARAGSRRTRPSHARGSAAHPGSAG